MFVGSFNSDPRSRKINTELGLLIHSPELAQQVADFIESGLDLENSYRVELTEGRGDAVLRPAGYEPVPARLAEAVISGSPFRHSVAG